MTLASIPLMDRTGRRTLHLYGLGGMFIFSIFITISFLIKASIQHRSTSNYIQWHYCWYKKKEKKSKIGAHRNGNIKEKYSIYKFIFN